VGLLYDLAYKRLQCCQITTEMCLCSLWNRLHRKSAEQTVLRNQIACESQVLLAYKPLQCCQITPKMCFCSLFRHKQLYAAGSQMANSMFAQALSRFPHMHVAQALQNTKIIIISVDASKERMWRQSKFWDAMAIEGISISFLAEPCVYKKTGKESIAQIEARKRLFTKTAWNKMQKEGPAISICISHLRALHQALNSGGNEDSSHKTELIVILEEDMVPEVDSAELSIATLIANFYGNRHMAKSMLVGLTWSQQLPHFQIKKNATKHTLIKNSQVNTYHQLFSAPYTCETYENQILKLHFEFIGQGARAQAYSRDFAKQLLTAPVNNYWDLHVLQKIAERVQEHYNRTGDWMASAYTFIEPIGFSHPILYSERLRGSGRLQASSQGQAEETAFYFMLSFSKQWGLANRIQALMFWATFAGMHQAGIYVLWEAKEACNCVWDDIFDVLNLEEPPFSKIPFIKIMSTRHDSFWKAPVHNKYYCLGKVESQAEYSTACGRLSHLLKQKRTEHPHLKNWLDPSIAQLDKYSEKDTKMWLKILTVHECILIDFKSWWSKYARFPEMQAAVHVRRGDHVFFNRDRKIKESQWDQERRKITEQWRRADDETIDWIRQQLDYGMTVHVITDDQHYRDWLQSLYHDEIHHGKLTFGPNGDRKFKKIQTKPDLSITSDVFVRPTSIQDAVKDFLVLAFVEHVAWTKNSTVTHFAKYLRHKYAKSDFYSTEVTIGDFPPHDLSRQFQADLQVLTQAAESLLINPDDFKLPPVLANVLNFLSDNHLEEIYKVFYAHLVSTFGEKTNVKGSKMGKILYDSCRVAEINSNLWKEACRNLTDANRYHWMKALIRYRLRNWTIRAEKNFWVEMTDDKDPGVYLALRPSNSRRVDNNSGEKDSDNTSGEKDSEDEGPPRKKFKNASAAPQVDWVQANLPMLSDETKDNVRLLFRNADFDPSVFVRRVEQVNMTAYGKGMWLRLMFHPDRVQSPTRVVPKKDAWLMQGLHSTSASGAVFILRQRRLTRMQFAGVYCVLTVQPKNFEDIKRDVASKVLGGRRDYAGVSFELIAKGKYDSHRSGTTDTDAESVHMGRVSHMKTTTENRWCVPEDLIELHALWLHDGSLPNMDTVDLHDL